MIRSYKEDRLWSDAHMPFVKKIIGPFLLQESTLEEDRRFAKDLGMPVLRGRDVSIGVRIRRETFHEKYADEFTVRSWRPKTGRKTELHKIVTEGWGHFLFYGFAKSERIYPWKVIDLVKLRASLARPPYWPGFVEGRIAGEKLNPDGTKFVWFKHDLLPINPIIASSEPLRLVKNNEAA